MYKSKRRFFCVKKKQTHFKITTFITPKKKTIKGVAAYSNQKKTLTARGTSAGSQTSLILKCCP